MSTTAADLTILSRYQFDGLKASLSFSAEEKAFDGNGYLIEIIDPELPAGILNRLQFWGDSPEVCKAELYASAAHYRHTNQISPLAFRRAADAAFHLVKRAA